MYIALYDAILSHPHEEFYFLPEGCQSSFHYDGKKVFTRLWDGATVNGFFTGVGKLGRKVRILTGNEAATLAIAYRQIKT